MSRAVRFHEFGSADVLKIEEVHLGQPGPDEILMSVEAIGLNRAEVVFREGKYLERAVNFPSRIGYEASGIVEAIGQGVKDFKPGDKVSTIPAFSMAKYGVYGDAAIVPAAAVAHYPDNLDKFQATAIWMQYLTAYGALLEYGKMTEKDVVVITAGSSSVGFAAVELVNCVGATSIVTTRTQQKKQALLDSGAKHVIVTDEEDLAERVMEITAGKGASIMFDPVAGPMLKSLADASADQATIFEYGALSMTTTPYPLMIALKKGLNVRGYTLFEITGDKEKLHRAKSYIYEKLKTGAIKPVLDKTFKLENIADAHKYMESNEQLGKILVSVN